MLEAARRSTQVLEVDSGGVSDRELTALTDQRALEDKSNVNEPGGIDSGGGGLEGLESVIQQSATCPAPEETSVIGAGGEVSGDVIPEVGTETLVETKPLLILLWREYLGLRPLDLP